jgi:6-phosphogluconolactonase
LTDERCVPPDDERSNYRMVKAALLDRLTLGNVHPIHGELGRHDGAERYEQELASLKRFDLVLLGLGADGHVASLFPNEPTLDVVDRRVVGAEAKLEPFVDRITLTLPALCGAREMLFLVTGADKAAAAKRAFVDEPSRKTPGSLARSLDGTTTVVLDAAAAAEI